MSGSSGKRGRERHGAGSNQTEKACRPSEFLTVADVAILLRVSRKTVTTKLIGRGLPGYLLPVRGGWRFRRQEILEWLEQQKLEDG